MYGSQFDGNAAFSGGGFMPSQTTQAPDHSFSPAKVRSISIYNIKSSFGFLLLPCWLLVSAVWIYHMRFTVFSDWNRHSSLKWFVLRLLIGWLIVHILFGFEVWLVYVFLPLCFWRTVVLLLMVMAKIKLNFLFVFVYWNWITRRFYLWYILQKFCYWRNEVLYFCV